MAGVSLLALLDDIASVLDDVAMMTKIAARKTAGVLGDDLALNAQQVAGVRSERELPVVWNVAKGSLVNKLILVPSALIISALAPSLIQPLLMIGGAYLCYEGAEKLWHKYFSCHQPQKPKETHKSSEKNIDPILWEKNKIKGAVKTDFVLSAEIIVISLGVIPADASLLVRSTVLSVIGLLMTIGVYGLVAGIVKLDDAGLYLMKNNRVPFFQKIGRLLVNAAPHLMRFLSVVGTAAMFLVGGGILAHGLPLWHYVASALQALPWPGITSGLAQGVFGILAGSLMVPLVMCFKKITLLIKGF